MASLKISITTLSILSLLITLSEANTTCKSQTFSNKKTFENCNDLPSLGATLHWTYDAAKSTLSMGFTASPPKPEGWVAWALNPTGSGMVGAQALIAYKPTSTDPMTVDTLDIQSYHALVKGPLSYNVSNLSAEETSDGHVSIFATWALPSGETTFNQVWQVGPILGGKPSKHEFEQSNLSSKTKLSLAGNGLSDGPSGSPEPVSGGSSASQNAAAPSPVGNEAAQMTVKSFVLALVLALCFSFFF